MMNQKFLCVGVGGRRRVRGVTHGPQIYKCLLSTPHPSTCPTLPSLAAPRTGPWAGGWGDMVRGCPETKLEAPSASQLGPLGWAGGGAVVKPYSVLGMKGGGGR
jgi:hypothetical protein